MIILNITENENLCFSSLKLRREDGDFVLGPGYWKDTITLGLADERIQKDPDVLLYLNTKPPKIKLLKETAEIETAFSPEEKEKYAEKEREKQITEIMNSSDISTLEDMLNNKNLDVKIRTAVVNRLVDLTGEGQFENPELKNTQQNPMIGR